MTDLADDADDFGFDGLALPHDPDAPPDRTLVRPLAAAQRSLITATTGAVSLSRSSSSRPSRSGIDIAAK